jgi:uncharacterized protein YdaU (DUF1376 family)
LSDWYPWYPGLFEGDTMHLDEGQDGVYRRLLDWYMSRRRPLPDNDAALAAIARVPLDRWMERYADAVRPFFKAHSGLLGHKRCDLELDRQDNRSKTRSEVAKKGGEARQRKIKDIKASSLHEASSEQANGSLEASFEQASSKLNSATGQDKTGQDKEPDRASPLTPRARTVSRDWRPSAEIEIWAALQKWTKEAVETEIEGFRAWSIGHGKSYADIDESFRSWLIKARQFARKDGGKDSGEKPKSSGVWTG